MLRTKLLLGTITVALLAGGLYTVVGGKLRDDVVQVTAVCDLTVERPPSRPVQIAVDIQDVLVANDLWTLRYYAKPLLMRRTQNAKILATQREDRELRCWFTRPGDPSRRFGEKSRSTRGQLVATYRSMP